MLKYHETSEYKLSQEIDEYSPTHFSDLEKDEQSKIASLWVAYKVDLTKDSGWFYDCLDHEYAVQLLAKLNQKQAITLDTFRNTFLNEYYELIEFFRDHGRHEIHEIHGSFLNRGSCGSNESFFVKTWVRRFWLFEEFKSA